MLHKCLARPCRPAASASLLTRRSGITPTAAEHVARRWLNTSHEAKSTFGTTTEAAAAAAGGTIADVFASLSGKSLEDALPPRFADLKHNIASSHPDFRQHLEASWCELLPRLAAEMAAIERGKQSVIPAVDWPGDETARAGLDKWMSPRTQDEVRKRGVVIVRGVVPQRVALGWKEEISEYAARNGAKGFPADDPQVFELYWTKAQVAARSHPALLTASRSILEMWHRPPMTDQGKGPSDAAALGVEEIADMSTPLTYADRLRIRSPGDATFALGPHIDGGGVERWGEWSQPASQPASKARRHTDRHVVRFAEDPAFLSLWQDILSPSGLGWKHFDNWSLGPRGQRMTAQTGMYNGPGQCSIFRPLQGWLSLSRTGPGEGTLRVLPNLREVTAYIIMRPFFQARTPLSEHYCDEEEAKEKYLAPSNWHFDGSSSRFPGCSVGHNLELSPLTHPHLKLDKTMVSLPKVSPGDLVLWHCDAVHSVEAAHRGEGDSSVMYIPAVPLTANNWRYVLGQAEAFRAGRPPSDFPPGEGEAGFQGRAGQDGVTGDVARRAMGLAPVADTPADAAVQRLRAYCNATMAERVK